MFCLTENFNILRYFLHIIAIKDDTNIYPFILKAKLETRARFTCISLNEAKWYFSRYSRTPVHTRLPSDGYSFIIKWVEQKDAGYYFCSGIDIETHHTFIAMSQLKVYGEYFC